MEQNKKNLKAMSIVVLVLAGLSLLSILFELFFGNLNEAFKSASLPEGATDGVILVAKIVIAAISLLLLLPQIYIGIKGIKVAKNPDNSNGHIVWGIILIIVTAIGVISPISGIIQGGAIFKNIADLCSIIVDIVILYEYVVFAKAVKNGL